MASLFFTCPTTHQQAPTGIETDVQSLRAAWEATLNVKCPHCGEVHEISVRETYINGGCSRAGYSTLRSRPIASSHGLPVRMSGCQDERMGFALAIPFANYEGGPTKANNRLTNGFANSRRDAHAAHSERSHVISTKKRAIMSAH
jgi:hypothetical protein